MENEILGKKYELTVVTQSEDAASTRASVAKHGVKVLNERPAAKIQLAYKIAKQGFGFVTTLEVLAEGPAVAEIKKELDLDKDVLRAMIATLKEIKEDRDGKKAPKVSDAAEAKIKNELGSMLTNDAIEKKIEEISN